MDAVYRAESRPPTAPARFGLSVPLAESHGGVNATYIFLIWELVDRRPVHDVPPKVRRIMRGRSIATLCLFGAAAVVALKYPFVGLGICVCCLVVYLKPEAPGAETRISRSSSR